MFQLGAPERNSYANQKNNSGFYAARSAFYGILWKNAAGCSYNVLRHDRAGDDCRPFADRTNTGGDDNRTKDRSAFGSGTCRYRGRCGRHIGSRGLPGGRHHSVRQKRVGQLTALTNQLKALNGDYIPLFLCVDEEGGRVSRMPPEITDIPCAYTYGNLSKPNLLTHLGSTLGAECAAFGLNLDFAPVMDVFSNPDNTVIGDRSYSSVPDTAAWAAALVAGGLRDTGIIAAGKHFPGHGDTVTDSHTELPVIDKTREEWNQTDAVPFREAVRSGIPVIMTGHILMSSLDSENPATLSHTIVTEILREEMGFDGVICTDDLTMGAISKTYGIGEAAVRAVAAGCDLLLICHESENLKAAYDALCAAVESGRISEERLNESVSRILSLKIEYKLTNDPIAIPDVDALNRQIKEILP